MFSWRYVTSEVLFGIGLTVEFRDRIVMVNEKIKKMKSMSARKYGGQEIWS